MLDPHELVAVSWHLYDKGNLLLPGNMYLRRAVSTAYYAVFHMILQAAAERFAGKGQEKSAAYALLYRGFDHHRMKTVCDELKKDTLKARFTIALGRSQVSQDMKDVATTFTQLQGQRHTTDYDPTYVFERADVLDCILSAESAFEAFDRIAPEEKADVLALLLVGTRP